MTLPPGLGASWLDPLRGLPARALSGDDPTAALPRRVAAMDEAEQHALELGGVFVSLRRRGLPWIAIARSVDLPLAEVLTLARHYALRAAAEVTRDALPAAETAPSLPQ